MKFKEIFFEINMQIGLEVLRECNQNLEKLQISGRCS